jgi:sulfoxide reductase catalytic subunit YedY
LDAIQKLTYAFVIFILAPFQVLTGAAQSPAIEARFPRGGRQWARTLHFFGLLAFLGFIAVHLMMVRFWGWAQLNGLMIFGDVRDLPLVFWLSLRSLPRSWWCTLRPRCGA